MGLESSDYLKKIEEAAAFIRRRLLEESKADYQDPKFGIICGSGLGGLAGRLKDHITIEYSEIPGFPTSTVSGHHGKLAFGRLKGVVTVCMIGRAHYYEGNDLRAITLPVRVFSRLGINTLLITNAAGAVDPTYQVGDVMAIEDHISFPQLSGMNPLRGENLDGFGPRFVALTRVYFKDTFEYLREAARRAGYDGSVFIRRGVYCAVGGPTYETPAEVRFLRMIGGSCVGMSTVPEMTVAVHSGIERLLAFSLITNRCVAVEDDTVAPSHAEVLEASKLRVDQLENIVENLTGLLFP